MMKWMVVVAVLSSAARFGRAQEDGASQIAVGRLDPARREASLLVPRRTHLREEFIWTRGDAAALNPAMQAKVRGQNDKIEPHYFRRRFDVGVVPRQATLYVAGPRSAKVFLNGTQVLEFADDGSRAKGLSVVTAEVAHALRRGENVLAVEEVRGHSSLHTGASPTINQVTYGEVLVAKIVPRSIAVDAAALVVSDGAWRSVLRAGDGWMAAGFDDSAWPVAQSIGAIDSKTDFLQWNADAGLYAWPGYGGIGPAMRTFRLPVMAVRDVVGSVGGLDAAALSGRRVFDAGAEAVTLDFGREVSGRVRLVSAGGAAATVETSYGESAEEAMGHPYLGVRKITVPARGVAYGPKSAFRYVRVTFPAGGSRWSGIDVEGIAYPVEYRGSFESSDALLNRIWETGAYTAHLCMQEGIWDAPKRDRGRWMGDLDVTGRTINSVFADRRLMEETMEQVIGEEPVKRDVNTIAGYSALWITGQADFYRHGGDIEYLRRMQGRLLDLLTVMDGEVDASGLFTNPEKHKVFVDWSAGFSADTPEARAATQFEFYLAYREAVYLLGELGDEAHAGEYRVKADRLGEAAQAKLLGGAGTFGERWQTNAMAVVSGAASAEEQGAIWSRVLAHVGDEGSTAVVTPYYGYYVLSAMAKVGHRAEALAWMRRYWGGMIAEGATSFWEAYDPHWPKEDFHKYLEADNKKGYYVSLAHGWASGPTAWLMEQVLGIEATGAGFRTVTIRPDLAGLEWARGAEPTPRGVIRVAVKADRVTVGLPVGTTATVVLPFSARDVVLENGRVVAGVSVEDGRRSAVTLDRAGEYVFMRKGFRP
jgi:alpha-L-rhamnosidase